jgi:hypothetical protein
MHMTINVPRGKLFHRHTPSSKALEPVDNRPGNDSKASRQGKSSTQGRRMDRAEDVAGLQLDHLDTDKCKATHLLSMA